MRSVTFEALWRDGPVNAQPGAPREEKSTGMRTSRSYLSSNMHHYNRTRKTANTPTLQRWRRQRSEHRRCRARKSVINVSPALYFLSDQKVARERRPRGQTGNSKRVPMRAKKKTLLSRDVWTFCLCLRFSPCCFRSVDCADTSSNAHHTGASAAQRSNSGGQSCTKLIYKSSPPGATQTGCYNQLISVSFVGLGGFKSNIVQLIWPFE